MILLKKQEIIKIEIWFFTSCLYLFKQFFKKYWNNLNYDYNKYEKFKIYYLLLESMRTGQNENGIFNVINVHWEGASLWKIFPKKTPESIAEKLEWIGSVYSDKINRNLFNSKRPDTPEN